MNTNQKPQNTCKECENRKQKFINEQEYQKYLSKLKNTLTSIRKETGIDTHIKNEQTNQESREITIIIRKNH